MYLSNTIITIHVYRIQMHVHIRSIRSLFDPRFMRLCSVCVFAERFPYIPSITV